MEKENSYDRAKITYEEFKNIFKMLHSSESDRDLAISILANVDQKQALPYILFILMETAFIKQDKSLLWRMYGKIPICKNLNKIVNMKALYGQNPFDYTSPTKILELVNQYDSYSVDSYNKNYIDKMIHSMSINQITDSILVQDNPREYFPLEVDITEMMIKMFDEFQVTHSQLTKSCGLTIKFDIQDALNTRKDAKQK